MKNTKSINNYQLPMKKRTILEVAFGPRTTHSHQDCQKGLKTCKSLYDKGLPESQYTT